MAQLLKLAPRVAQDHIPIVAQHHHAPPAPLEHIAAAAQPAASTALPVNRAQLVHLFVLHVLRVNTALAPLPAMVVLLYILEAQVLQPEVLGAKFHALLENIVPQAQVRVLYVQQGHITH